MVIFFAKISSFNDRMDTADSEPEDMEEDQSTPDSEKTDEDDSESDSSGSEDSSEYDEEDCEKRREECMDYMNELERQFTDLRELLYFERIGQVEYRLTEVQKEGAAEYLIPLSDLEKSIKMRAHVAGVLRELRLNNINNKHESESKGAHENHESEKMLLKDALRAELEEKIRRLEEDRHNIDLTTELWNESQALKQKGKKFDSLHPDRKKKPVTVSGPYIIYMLRDHEILDDWTAIMKAKGLSRRKDHLKQEKNPYNARYDDGKLFYEGRWFNRKDRIIIENRDDQPVYATVTAINTGEVWVKRPDGTKSKLYISNLQRGKYTIKHT